MSDSVPFDIQMDIMNRLPVKSLLQFRTVSKQWKSCIDLINFQNTYGVRSCNDCCMILRYNQALPTYMLALNQNLTYSPLVTTLNNSTLLPIGTCHGIWESIRFKRSSQAVVGQLLFWAGHERFVNDDGVMLKKDLLVSFDLIAHSFQVHDIDAIFRDDLIVPMYISSHENSLIVSGSTYETEFYLFCGWSLLVDVTSITSFTLLFAIPTPGYVKLLGFSNDEIPLPIVEVPGAHQLANSVQVFNIVTQSFQNLGIQGVASSFYIGPYKESLILLPYPDRAAKVDGLLRIKSCLMNVVDGISICVASDIDCRSSCTKTQDLDPTCPIRRRLPDAGQLNYGVSDGLISTQLALDSPVSAVDVGGMRGLVRRALR
ncbi:F-box domain containing protein [Tanacetum coccineum]